ncbi:hypothetical protein [Streptomyces candidus]|uniref:Uncharacterized protein n=1 Tax=Streptomyces candidus TaxID=67283 RepID=A0A7X0HKB4_9ACTN|nr:hypothetical protein [Streptomyces candidus]MBB6439251.1 hypothetical protein [Streptomyces candidus]GHH44876.1 hypothetical protein GCM10018773_33220 [Streptomyces candidus]
MTPAPAPAAAPAAPAASRPRLRQVTAAGTALAVVLLPLAAGVLVAKGMAADPHAPVNALMTSGGPRATLPHAEWKRRGHATARRLRTVRHGVVRLRTVRSGVVRLRTGPHALRLRAPRVTSTGGGPA